MAKQKEEDNKAVENKKTAEDDKAEEEPSDDDGEKTKTKMPRAKVKGAKMMMTMKMTRMIPKMTTRKVMLTVVLAKKLFRQKLKLGKIRSQKVPIKFSQQQHRQSPMMMLRMVIC